MALISVCSFILPSFLNETILLGWGLGRMWSSPVLFLDSDSKALSCPPISQHKHGLHHMSCRSLAATENIHSFSTDLTAMCLFIASHAWQWQPIMKSSQSAARCMPHAFWVGHLSVHDHFLRNTMSVSFASEVMQLYAFDRKVMMFHFHFDKQNQSAFYHLTIKQPMYWQHLKVQWE